MSGPWVMRMRWLNLLFAHWPVDAGSLRRLIPAGLELDQFKGRAYVGAVPFRMENVGARGLPAIPVLTREGTNREALKRILARIATSDPTERGAALTDLMILAGLRKLGAVIEKERLSKCPFLTTSWITKFSDASANAASH